ncbi:ribose-phosphate pyrophosphokinase [Platysternon megacephalum]|uniref:Ribose-phosphate pyrophosphokinase n=1 Tax=Platysternon megacephalum TaxID=55544 RepID=A0A4D9DNX3_9SAUR|nr:ribose-phosphate pyrophosphokinase [Platysternon megacephalum]
MGRGTCKSVNWNARNVGGLRHHSLLGLEENIPFPSVRYYRRQLATGKGDEAAFSLSEETSIRYSWRWDTRLGGPTALRDHGYDVKNTSLHGPIYLIQHERGWGGSQGRWAHYHTGSEHRQRKWIRCAEVYWGRHWERKCPVPLVYTATTGSPGMVQGQPELQGPRYPSISHTVNHSLLQIISDH